MCIRDRATTDSNGGFYRTELLSMGTSAITAHRILPSVLLRRTTVSYTHLHLIAAKLCLILPEGSFEIHGASVADGPTDRNGDFVIGNTVIHCTTMPGALLIEKCKANLRAGCHSVIITIFDRVHTCLLYTSSGRCISLPGWQLWRVSCWYGAA